MYYSNRMCMDTVKKIGCIHSTVFRIAVMTMGIIGLSVENLVGGEPGGVRYPTPTPFSMDLYGVIKDAMVGDELTVIDANGLCCGRFIIKKDGEYGFLHVYGDDKSTLEDEGVDRNEELFFKLNGAPLKPVSGESVRWTGDRHIQNIDFIP